MCKNNGWIYLIVYFIMFPLGFQGAKLLDRWLNDINEQISGMHIFYLWLLVVGILAGFVPTSYAAFTSAAGHGFTRHVHGLSSAVCAFHMILGILISIFAPAQILFVLFGYMFSTRYVILLVMLFTFLVTNLTAGRRLCILSSKKPK